MALPLAIGTRFLRVASVRRRSTKRLAKASMKIGLTTQSRDDDAAFVRYDAA